VCVEGGDLLAEPPNTPEASAGDYERGIVQEYGAITSLAANGLVGVQMSGNGRVVGHLQATGVHRSAIGAYPTTSDEAAVQTLRIACNQHCLTLPG